MPGTGTKAVGPGHSWTVLIRVVLGPARSARAKWPTIAWSCRTDNSDLSAVIAAKLKVTRSELRAWGKNKPNLSQQETDCWIVINLLGYVEESRALSQPEHNLRTLIVTILSTAGPLRLNYCFGSNGVK